VPDARPQKKPGNQWPSREIDLLVAENVTFRLGGSKNILIHWWLTRQGTKIGGWVEVDWWLQKFCWEIKSEQA